MTDATHAGTPDDDSPQRLTFRPARSDDTDRIATIIHGDPSAEAIAMVGGVERARAIGYALVRTGLQGWRRTVLAEAGSEALGVLQAGDQIGGTAITPSLVLAALRILGPVDAVRMVPRLRAQAGVNAPAPAGAYHIAELHVAPERRGQGIGGALLDHAEEVARNANHRQMSLVTTLVNPARRLYERHGFVVTETRRDPAYERYTGIPGRVLMVKELT